MGKFLFFFLIWWFTENFAENYGKFSWFVIRKSAFYRFCALNLHHLLCFTIFCQIHLDLHNIFLFTTRKIFSLAWKTRVFLRFSWKITLHFRVHFKFLAMTHLCQLKSAWDVQNDDNELFPRLQTNDVDVPSEEKLRSFSLFSFSRERPEIFFRVSTQLGAFRNFGFILSGLHSLPYINTRLDVTQFQTCWSQRMENSLPHENAHNLFTKSARESEALTTCRSACQRFSE